MFTNPRAEAVVVFIKSFTFYEMKQRRTELRNLFITYSIEHSEQHKNSNLVSLSPRKLFRVEFWPIFVMRLVIIRNYSFPLSKSDILTGHAQHQRHDRLWDFFQREIKKIFLCWRREDLTRQRHANSLANIKFLNENFS